MLFVLVKSLNFIRNEHNRVWKMETRNSIYDKK